ncbi:hypothetical protein DOY81_013538 [Sarcophaga bullata]|nr:hypothetical protein DOY81_013538 [Sarcophaga bullata]
MCSTDFGVPGNLFKNINTPANYSHINNRFDKLLFFHKLDVILTDYPEHIQKSIFLLKHGVRSSDIHLFIPYKSESVIKLNNSSQDVRIEEICREMVEDLGVHVHDEMHWVSYNLQENNGNLKDVTFIKHVTDEKLTMNVDLFISYYEVYLDANMVNMFEVAYITTENNLVRVNENYRTTQYDIYAIGNHIKHRQEPNHQYRFVSAQESAEKIINVLNLIENTAAFPKPDEKFSKPHYFQAQLPMEHFFVKVTSPKRYLAHHLGNEYEYPLITYDDGDFCRVRLNQHGIVEEIVVVTQKSLGSNYYCTISFEELSNNKISNGNKSAEDVLKERTTVS